MLLRDPIHFVGLGGSGMSPLAEIARARGLRVSGSDSSASSALTRLSCMGVRTHIGHTAQNVGDAATVVLSSAIAESNPERQEALSRGLVLLHRVDALRALMDPASIRVAIAGSHGKTTTTAMVSHILAAAGFDPTAVVGGKIKSLNSGARVGTLSTFVAEADESDRSFLRLDPTHAVVTNVDLEHLDEYRDFDDIEFAFATFATRLPDRGALIVCADDVRAMRVAKRARSPVVTYGFASEAQVRGSVVSRIDGHMAVEGMSPAGGFRFVLPLSGDMNAQNAIGAFAMTTTLGVNPALASRALASFEAVGRRLEWKGETSSGVSIFDDYGHHPTEIRATIAALRTKVPSRRIVVLFQPHRFTRTASLWNEFKECFGGADRLFLADIYAASEAPLQGISSERLAKEISRCVYAGSVQAAQGALLSELKAGDVLLTLGAGNVVDAGEALLNAARGRAL